MSTLETLAKRREEFRNCLYKGKGNLCTLNDMTETSRGTKKVIFPLNGYEAEYKDQTFTITNSRDHEDLHLTIHSENKEEADRILACVQTYRGEACLDKDYIKDDVEQLKKEYYFRASMYALAYEDRVKEMSYPSPKLPQEQQEVFSLIKSKFKNGKVL